MSRRSCSNNSASSEQFPVDSLIACRKIAEDWQVLVKWKGFADLDNTWEPVTVLLEDIPVTVQSFIESHPNDQEIQAMATDLALLPKEGGVAGPRRVTGRA